MTEPGMATQEAASPLRLLVVDDSAMMRTLIKRAAAASSLPIGQIFEAANGREALAVLETQDVDAIFTDINMPEMTGIELLQQMHTQARWRNVLRVIISTDGSESRRAEADALNVRHYVNKPFRPEVMRDVLSDLTATR